MRLPSLAAFAAICLTAAPAAAQDYPGQDPYRDALPAQDEIDRTAGAMHNVLDALLQIRVGPLVDAVDPEARHHRYRDETLGDVARRDDPYFGERLHHSVDGATRGMGEMMTRMARLAPVLERTLEDVERSVDHALHEVPDDYRD